MQYVQSRLERLKHRGKTHRQQMDQTHLPTISDSINRAHIFWSWQTENNENISSEINNDEIEQYFVFYVDDAEMCCGGILAIDGHDMKRKWFEMEVFGITTNWKVGGETVTARRRQRQ
jgi:hypothetical protein